MEIVSVVLHGEMTHKDTMGNVMVVKQHDVQRMTAGTGLQHSEWNQSDEAVGFFQIWIFPDKKGLKPSYDLKSFLPEHWKNRLALLASHQSSDHAVKLNTEAIILRADLDTDKEVSYDFGNERYLFLYIIEGNLIVNGLSAERRDQVRVGSEKHINITAQSKCDFLLIDVPGR